MYYNLYLIIACILFIVVSLYFIAPKQKNLVPEHFDTHIQKVPICPDLSKYILKTDIPTCSNIDTSKYILKTSISPNDICPDMKDYTLTSNIKQCKACNNTDKLYSKLEVDMLLKAQLDKCNSAYNKPY